MKNNLKQLILKGRVKALFKMTEDGKLVIYGYQRVSSYSKKRNRIYFLDDPVQVEITTEEAAKIKPDYQTILNACKIKS